MNARQEDELLRKLKVAVGLGVLGLAMYCVDPIYLITVMVYWEVFGKKQCDW